MDDSDEEYMARAAAFTENLFLTLGNPSENQENVGRPQQQNDRTTQMDADISRTRNETRDTNDSVAPTSAVVSQQSLKIKGHSVSVAEMKPLPRGGTPAESRGMVISDDAPGSRNSLPATRVSNPNNSASRSKLIPPAEVSLNYQTESRKLEEARNMDSNSLRGASTSRVVAQHVNRPKSQGAVTQKSLSVECEGEVNEVLPESVRNPIRSVSRLSNANSFTTSTNHKKVSTDCQGGLNRLEENRNINDNDLRGTSNADAILQELLEIPPPETNSSTVNQVTNGIICGQQPLMRNSRPVVRTERPRSVPITVAQHQRPPYSRNQTQLASSVLTTSTSQNRRPLDRNTPTNSNSRQQPEIVRPPLISRPSLQHQRIQPARPVDDQMNQEIRDICVGVANLSIRDSEVFLEQDQRTSVPAVTRFIPIIGSSAPADDQTTWVEEQTADRSQFPIRNNDHNPGGLRSALVEERADDRDTTIGPINPSGQEYPEMFTNLRRQLVAQDIENERQRNGTTSFRGQTEGAVLVNLGMDNNEPENFHPQNFSELATRSSVDVPRRPGPLFPPIAKGRLSSLPPSFGNPRVSAVSNRIPASQHSSDTRSGAALNIRQSNGETTKHDSRDSANAKYLENLSSDVLEKMSEEELQQVTNSFYESGPRLKFKESFPFMAEGVVQKDNETAQLRVYSQRLGRIMLQDNRLRRTEDYVYFIAIKPGVNKGLWFDTHPKCLISAKFPSAEKLVLRGYAILAHPIGSHEESVKESRWICWNDSLGLMPVISGSARTPLKKHPGWDKQLDVISIHANFENRRFVVVKIVSLTNSKEKKYQFPEEVFLVKDAVFTRQCEDDLIFFSSTLNAQIFIKKTLVGEVQTFEKRAFELVVVPTFPRCTALEFRAMLIIDKPEVFWVKEKTWIRDLLVKRTDSYRS